jgi:hypothetical protein
LKNVDFLSAVQTIGGALAKLENARWRSSKHEDYRRDQRQTKAAPKGGARTRVRIIPHYRPR